MNFELKKLIRKEMKSSLTSFHASLTPKEKQALSESILLKVTSLEEYKNALNVFAYIPDVLEADCTPVILDALKKGKKVFVPKVNAVLLKQGISEMDFYLLEPEKSLESQLAAGTYGIKEPQEGLKKFEFSEEAAAAGHFECGSFFMLVPGVAFSTRGKRLGHGKGFYDIYIEKLKKAGIKPYLCGIALPCQIISDIPTEEHDILMNKVIVPGNN